MTTYARTASRRQTPQSQPIPSSGQVQNSAGGYSFKQSIWQMLDSFLILGQEGRTYYASERKGQRKNTANLEACIQADGQRTVERIREISQAGRAPKNDPAIFALALAAVNGDKETKEAAYRAWPDVCRTGTHLFQFEHDLRELKKKIGSSGLKKGYKRWIEALDRNDLAKLTLDNLANQLIKYRSREGLDHTHLLYSHRPKLDLERAAIMRWPLIRRQGESPSSKYFGRVEFPHPLIEGFEKLQAESEPVRAASLIRQYGLPREAVPTELLNSPLVWEALLERMPMTALIRNLATMTRIGLIAPLSEAAKKVQEELANAERIRKARVHPIQILMALKTYSEGKGDKGKHTWAPVESVVDALDEAFYLAFDNVQSTGKNWFLGLDVSGSMSMGRVGGVNLTPAEAVAALSLVTARTEKNSFIFGFAEQFRDLGISPRMRLNEVVRKTRGLAFGSTDCSQPMVYALEKQIPVDLFMVMTDNETWAGRRIHPVQALDLYNQKMNKNAKLVVVGMVSNGFSIADPNRSDMLDVVGFDTAVPTLIREFAVS